ncbi:MAG: hypothetical protein M3275_12870 [Thermoproteota archaeon]|nr:hypothetical protein [Thermoproteota archaeon]
MSYRRPLAAVISTPQQQAEAIILPPEVQQIFDSFQLLSNQGAVPPVGENEVFRAAAAAAEAATESCNSDIVKA